MFVEQTTDSTMLVEDEVDEGEDEGGVIASGETRYNVRAKVDRKKKKGKVKKGAMRTGNALVETDSTGRKVCYVKGHPEKEMYVRGPWTTEEDEQLMSLVAEMGPRRWCKIAEHMELRIGKQCRERCVCHGPSKECRQQCHCTLFPPFFLAPPCHLYSVVPGEKVNCSH